MSSPSTPMSNGGLRHLSRSTHTPDSQSPSPSHSRAQTPSPSSTSAHSESDSRSHSHSQSGSHSHSHSHGASLFSAHTHSRDDGPSADVERIAQALAGRRDAGSRITLIGLAVNVGLTLSKGVAGWTMNSAALLAEAGHSASDLLGDFVTLFAWRLSRRKPTAAYPYGFGKFETLGTTAVSLILIAGALGIGVHAFALLTHHLAEAAATLPPGAAQALMQNATEVAQSVSSVVSSASAGILDSHSHAHAAASTASGAAAHPHAHSHALDPNAAWFALISIVAKEWLFRATRRVAAAEHSSVLLANAVHHRADAYTSAVALGAILGTWAFPALPLDPLGGLLVALVILRQGAGLFASAVGELTDAGVGPRTRDALQGALDGLVGVDAGRTLLGVEDVRAIRAGALLFVDVRVRVPKTLPVVEAAALEERMRAALLDVRREIAEVRVKFVPSDEEKTMEEER